MILRVQIQATLLHAWCALRPEGGAVAPSWQLGVIHGASAGSVYGRGGMDSPTSVLQVFRFQDRFSQNDHMFNYLIDDLVCKVFSDIAVISGL